MDKISLLQQRKQKLLNAGKKIRKDLSELIDEQSFVEISALSFSKNDFYDEDAEGEGVVCGFATVGGFPFYIVAQNYDVMHGGLSKANCEKISGCLDKAEKTSTPVIYLMSSLGVQCGEGVNVLEGLAALMLKASRLSGTVRQYMIVNGEVYGQVAALSAFCDFTFFIDDKSVLAPNSPLVISAKSNKNLSKCAIGGPEGLKKSNLVSFRVKNLGEIKSKILLIENLLSERLVDCENLNDSLPVLDKNVEYKNLIKIFDGSNVLEVGADFSPEIRCLIGRIGGMSVAAAVFDGDGVFLNAENIRKLKDFAEFACCYSLPYITFVNTCGIKADIETNNSLVLKGIGDYISVFDCIDTAKISVVYKKAIGLGYTLFAAKNLGFDYTFAFANAEISLFDGLQGAEIEFSGVNADKNKLASRYADEYSDPVNAAKNGYLDNVIQPAFVRQYLISSLQMLLK